MNLQYEAALLTDKGRVRELNEDALGLEPSAALFVLADGLGGYNAGEVASAMAVSAVLGRLGANHAQARRAGREPAAGKLLHQVITGINADIYNAAAVGDAYAGMATTLVVAWLIGSRLWVAHVGDSRLYRLRAGVLEQLTRDHSFNQEMLDAGMVGPEEARFLPAKNLVTRALGADLTIDPEVHEHVAEPGDLLLLCSDGLSEMVEGKEIAAALRAAPHDLQVTARALIHAANQAGGSDNISVLLVRLAGKSPQRVGSQLPRRRHDRRA